MNGPMAQSVALVCHANAALSGQHTDSFLPSHSTCQFCDQVGFVEVLKPLIGKAHEREVADSPDAWFKYLKIKGAVKVRLVYEVKLGPDSSDRMSAGFVTDGGGWQIEVGLPGAVCERWSVRWDVWDRNAPERRIWRVTYGLVQRAKAKPTQTPDLASVRERLLEALQAIKAFSEAHECGGFAETFGKAIETLTGGAKHGYHKDLSPQGVLPTAADTVLDATQSAWVFGGMGSWNDMAFEGAAQKEYERVSERLFETLIRAICVAANSSVADSGLNR